MNTSAVPDSSVPPSPRPPSRGSGRLLGVLVVALLVVTGFAGWRVWRHRPAPRPESEPPASLAEALGGKGDAGPRPGPWGDLRITRFTVERPDEFISLPEGEPPAANWQFIGFAPAELRSLMNELPLEGAVGEALRDESSWQQVPGGIVLSPTPELVQSLTPVARSVIYRELARFPENSAQFHAFKFRADAVDEWFARSGLAPGTEALVRPLLYPVGDALCFADYFEVIGQLPSNEERRRLFKTLSREAAVRMEVRLGSDTDLGPIVRYWGRGGRAKDVRPLLEGLRRVPGEVAVDVLHLLPPFARRTLNTFPFPSEDPLDRQRDCTWSALNFFAEVPDDRYCDPSTSLAALAQDFYPIQDAPTFGDIICLYDADQRLLHTAVYIADRIVYTKNGAYFSQPWLLMEFRDMVARYSGPAKLRVVAYRRRGGVD